jgi:hypothetical protein
MSDSWQQVDLVVWNSEVRYDPVLFMVAAKAYDK